MRPKTKITWNGNAADLNHELSVSVMEIVPPQNVLEASFRQSLELAKRSLSGLRILRWTSLAVFRPKQPATSQSVNEPYDLLIQLCSCTRPGWA